MSKKEEIEGKVDFFLKEIGVGMEGSCSHLECEFGRIRTGRASVQILDGVKVDYYGNLTAINELASINTIDGRTIVVKPWEKKLIGEIERAIIGANLGLIPGNNGEQITIVIPSLTLERREQIAKQARGESEKAKISIRNIRKGGKEGLKKLQKEGLTEDMEKRAEEKLQKLTDSYIEKVEKIYEKKEREIMTI